MREMVSAVVDEVGNWDGVKVNAHRFGGQEFNIGKVEIGHIHRNGMVDIPFTVKVREVLVAEGHSDVHHILPESGWISFYIQNEADIARAIWLYRLSYWLKQRGRARRNPDSDRTYQRSVTGIRLESGICPGGGDKPIVSQLIFTSVCGKHHLKATSHTNFTLHGDRTIVQLRDFLDNCQS